MEAGGIWGYVGAEVGGSGVLVRDCLGTVLENIQMLLCMHVRPQYRPTSANASTHIQHVHTVGQA